MDPLTHTLFAAGAAALPAARRRLVPAALILGANLPDVDGVTYLWGADTAFALRRGVTHGLPAVGVWALLLTAALLAWDRLRPARGGARARPGVLLAASLLAVASHPLLDWLNTYGVRLLAPFSDRWYYGDALFIIDPWLWLMLAGGLVLSRWLGPRPAAVGLVLALLYVTAMVGLAGAGRERVRAELDRRGMGPVQDLMVGPLPGRPLSQDVLLDMGASYRYGVHRWGGQPALVLDADVIPKALASPEAQQAMQDPAVQGTLFWMRYPFAVTRPRDGGTLVSLQDARYVRWPSRGFGSVRVLVPAQGGPAR